MEHDYAREFLLWAKSAIIGGSSATVGYMYLVIQRGLVLKWAAFALYVVIGAGLGLVIENAWELTRNEVTGKTWPGMGAVISLTGGSAFAIFGAIIDGMPALTQRMLDWAGGKLK